MIMHKWKEESCKGLYKRKAKLYIQIREKKTERERERERIGKKRDLEALERDPVFTAIINCRHVKKIKK